MGRLCCFLAGVVGFEPAVKESKSFALATWRYPRTGVFYHIFPAVSIFLRVYLLFPLNYRTHGDIINALKKCIHYNITLKGLGMKENRKLLQEVLRDIRHDMTDEEVLALLADSKISVSPAKEKYTAGQRAADTIAKFAGSWAFIFSFTGILIVWMVVNVILAAGAFDPYPFILLNLVLSCVAAIQAPLIMMSQNRQEEKDRRRAENDYRVNLKTEIMIEDLYDKVNAILSKQAQLEKLLSGKDVTDKAEKK